MVKENNVRLISTNGTNSFEIFSGSVIDQKAYPTPAGDRVVILSKFKLDAPENLYTISIR